MRLKRLKQIILVLFCKLDLTEDKSELKDINEMLEAVIMKYLSVKVGDEDSLEKCQRYDRTIESFSPSDCKIFKKGDLMRLFRLLHFPDVCRFDNKSVMPGEEIFLRGLYELVTGENKHSIANHELTNILSPIYIIILSILLWTT